MDAGDADLWSLNALARAHRLRDWMFDVVAPSRPGPMLEVGAGIGTFSDLLLGAGADPLLLVEPEPGSAAELERRFASDGRVEVVAETIPGARALAARSGSFSYVLCQNVLEHVEDDMAAVAELIESLAPGGELALLVPAHPRLYGRLDRGFGHHRRYTRERLRTVVEAGGAEIVGMRSFNLLGVPGWWLANRTRSIGIDARTLRVYELLVAGWRPLEELLRPSVGLSLVVRARRPV